MPSAVFALFRPADPTSNNKLTNKWTPETCQRQTLEKKKNESASLALVSLSLFASETRRRRSSTVVSGGWKWKRGPRCSLVALDLTLSQLSFATLFACRFALFMKCPQEVPPHYKACYYTLLGSESGPLCALPDNIVYTKQTDGTLHFNVFHWVWASVTHTGPWNFDCQENSVAPASGERADSVKSAKVHQKVQFKMQIKAVSNWIIVSLRLLYSNFNMSLYYYHSVTVASPFCCLLLCWKEPAVLLLLVFAGWFSCVQVHPPSCVLTDCPGWKCQNTS